MGLGIRGWRRVGLGLCKVGGVGPRSNSAPWILCSAVRTISHGPGHSPGPMEGYMYIYYNPCLYISRKGLAHIVQRPTGKTPGPPDGQSATGSMPDKFLHLITSNLVSLKQSGK